jgi:hypothetical protein
MSEKPVYITVSCRGFNPRTGKRVGSRHRWNGGIMCIWCGRFKDAIKLEVKPKP